jgi:hypothetical protein
MRRFTLLLCGLLAFVIESCNSLSLPGRKNHCGYEMNLSEYNSLMEKMERQDDPYGADTSGNIYDQLNDSIRAAMPDSVEFEIFLVLLNDKEVAVQVIVPPNPAYYDKIGCAVMNTQFPAPMPEQRHLTVYTYTNPDGSGDSPLAFAIKRKR